MSLTSALITAPRRSSTVAWAMHGAGGSIAALLLLLSHLLPLHLSFLFVSSLTSAGTDFFLGGKGFGSRGKSGEGSSTLLKGLWRSPALCVSCQPRGRYILGANLSRWSQHLSPDLGLSQLSPEAGVPRHYLYHSPVLPHGLWGSEARLRNVR